MTAPLSAVLRQVRGLTLRSQSQSLSDHHLLERFVSRRDEAAFALLVRRHGGLVLGVARRILHDAHAAEDVVQNTFLALARRAGSIRKREALASWLYGVAARLALRAQVAHLRRSARERRVRPPHVEEVMEAVSWRELGAVLDEELQRLAEKYRTPLVLIYFSGQTQEEAARQLGWSKNTLRRRLEDARRLLHARLLRRGVSLSIGLLVAGIAQSAAEASLPPALIQTMVQEVVRAAAAETALGAVMASLLARAKIALAVGLLAVAGAGAIVFQAATGEQPQTKQETAKPPAQEGQQPRVDRFGDPLPEGALVRLGTVRFRHGAGASLAFAPDGKTLLTCGADRAVRTWDAASGRLLRERRLPARPGMFSPVAVLSPDARLLVFEEPLGILVLWDVSRHQRRHEFALTFGGWPRAAFSPDGKTLVTSEYGGAVRAWDTATGKGRLLGEPKGMVYTLEFSDDGTLMSLGADRIVRFWDVAAGRERSRFTVPKEVVAAAVSPDGKTVATWTYWNETLKRELQFWDAASGKPKKEWKAPDMRGIHALRFLPDGQTILVGAGEQGGVLLWDAAAGKLVRTLAGQSGCRFALSPDGKTAASLGGELGPSYCLEPMVHVWDLSTGALRAANNPEHGHLGQVACVALAPDGRTLASSSKGDFSVRLWDAATGRPLHTLSLRKLGLSYHTLNFTPDGKHVLIATDHAVIRWEVATGREAGRCSLFGQDTNYHPLEVMHLSDDGRTLLALGQNRSPKGAAYNLLAWDTATGKCLRSVPLAVDDRAGSSRFSPDGRWLVLPNRSIRDTKTGKEVGRLPAEGEALMAGPMAFSPDGGLIAMGFRQVLSRTDFESAETFVVQVWETATLLPVARRAGREVSHLAFTPDGRQLVLVDAEGLKRWDPASGRVVAQQGAPGRIRGTFAPSFASSLGLAPNGRIVATGQTDTTVLLWDLSPTAAGRRPAPTAVEREALWNDLASADGGRAFAALARLTDVPEQTVPLLRDRLHPAKAPPAEELRRLIADLDDARFERREAAGRRLAELDDLAFAALREALDGKPSLEVRRRIEGLLAEAHLARTPAARRNLRAIRILEGMGTPEARQMLNALAAGAPDARLTCAARAACARLDRRAPP